MSNILSDESVQNDQENVPDQIMCSGSATEIDQLAAQTGSRHSRAHTKHGLSSSSSCCSFFCIKGMKTNSKLAFGLTFIQFIFALYATYLLYFMSPNTITSSFLHKTEAFMEASASFSPSSSWTSHVTRRWHQLFYPSKYDYYNGHLISPYYNTGGNASIKPMALLCEEERIDFEQKRSKDIEMVKIKQGLFAEILKFQGQSRGSCETLQELLSLPSRWTSSNNKDITSEKKITQPWPKVAVILNHYRRRTLCAQIEALLQQTLPFHTLWVMAFGLASDKPKFRHIVESFNDSRISFISSNYDFKYYGRFQLALQTNEADYVYLLDDDMIPGARVLEIFTHVAGTRKYGNALLGSIGRILPFKQQDGSFPSYRKFHSREAGLYVPDPAYGIVVDRMIQVDFLSSSWFLSAELVKTMLMETPFTFSTGEDLHLRYLFVMSSSLTRVC
mgnify:FL=1